MCLSSAFAMHDFVLISVFCFVLYGDADGAFASVHGGNRNSARIRRESRFHELDITTPEALYSEGESSLGRPSIVRGQTFTAPTMEPLHIPCPTSWEASEQNGGHHDSLPKCRPLADLWRVCFENNPCGLYSECEVVNATQRTCSCMSAYTGTPPRCERGAKERDRCKNTVCGVNAVCDPFAVKRCRCLPGFRIGRNPSNLPNCTAGPALLAKCNPYPCGGHSNCVKKRGNTVCTCLPGYVGNPPNCKPGHETWRLCFKDNACGHHSQCVVEQRTAVCGPCTGGSTGEPPFCVLAGWNSTQFRPSLASTTHSTF